MRCRRIALASSLAFLTARASATTLTEESLVFDVDQMLGELVREDVERWRNEKNSFVQTEEQEIDDPRNRTVSKREYPVMYMRNTKKVRTCQNVNGVLGGANAFNFLSFVSAVVTLVVNVNNNVNNNNNNLNGDNFNTNNQNNANANVNNNAANIIIVMPGRRRKRSNEHIWLQQALRNNTGQHIETGNPLETEQRSSTCARLDLRNELGNFALEVLNVMKDFRDKSSADDESCRTQFLCGSLHRFDTFRKYLRSREYDIVAT